MGPVRKAKPKREVQQPGKCRTFSEHQFKVTEKQRDTKRDLKTGKVVDRRDKELVVLCLNCGLSGTVVTKPYHQPKPPKLPRNRAKASPNNRTSS